ASDQTRSEAGKTIADANTQAKSKAEEAEKRSSGDSGSPPSGLWGRIKAAGSRAVSAIKDVASSVVAAVASILAAARERVLGLLSRLGEGIRRRVAAAVQVIRDGARRAWAAMGTAIRRAQQMISQLAASI